MTKDQSPVCLDLPVPVILDPNFIDKIVTVTRHNTQVVVFKGENEILII